jgi:hypothetical protein
MRRIGLGAVLGVVTAAALPARADLLRGWMDQPLTETAHTVEVKLDGGVARLTVRRTFHNDGAIPEEANLDVELPSGAVASSLRLRTPSAWENGVLLESQLATDQYEELTGIGDHRVLRDPALLEWVDVGTLSLRVFPVPPGGQATVEYELVMPTEYEGGRVVLHYPQPWREEDPAEEDGEKNLALPEVKVGKGGAVTRDEGSVRISLPPPEIDVMVARYGVFTVSDRGAVWRLELDAAPELAPKPKNARVAFVIDASYSVGVGGIAEQIALARGYMANLPDAKYEVILFRRDVARLMGRFVGAKDLDKELERAAAMDRLRPGNGSNLEAGLASAADALNEGKHKGASRIVVFTDGAMRDGFSPSLGVTLLRRAPKGTIVHVVRLADTGDAIFLDDDEGDDDGESLVEARDDSDPLAPIADSYGGVVLAIAGDGEPADYARVARGLVQPIRIDDFAVVTPGVDLGTEVPAQVVAGSGFRTMTSVDDSVGVVQLSGKLWAQPWNMAVAIDGAYTQRVGMLLFGDELLHSFSDDEEDLSRIAMTVKVVSPYTSFLAVEPGTKPSTQGVNRDPDRYATIGYGSGVGSGYGVGGGKGGSRQPDLVAILAEMLEPGARTCGALDPRTSPNAESGRAATLKIECTEREIVDVRLTGAPSAVIGTCVLEQAWGLRLTDDYKGHKTHEVSVAVLP